MSLKNKNNLIVIGGIIVALLAGTVLLAGYARFIPARSDSGPESKLCTSSGAGKACTGCIRPELMPKGPMAQAMFADNAQATYPSQVMAAAAPESCPAGRTEKCCAEDPPKDCCGEPCPDDCPKPCCEPCPPDCPKPCCAKQAEAAGCCPTEAATQ